MVVIFVLGTMLMRSAGCAINDFADREFDRNVKRTNTRPLATGVIKAWEAVAVVGLLVSIAFSLVLSLKPLTVALSFPALFFAATYPFMKRVFAFPQAYLGVAFGFGIPMAFAAVQGTVPVLAWLLVAANICWSVAYDTAYAMVDRDDDLKIGIRTSAITLGRYDVAIVMLCYLTMLGIYAGVGAYLHFGLAYWIGLFAACVCVVYYYRLIRRRARNECFAMFLHNKWFGAILFLGIVAHYSAFR